MRARRLTEPPRDARVADAEHAWQHLERADAASSPAIWWEAETATESNYPAENPFAPNRPVESAALSGGTWIGGIASGTRYFLEYEVQVPRPAEYGFYARKFWRHGPFRFRFDDAPWSEVSTTALLDGVVLRKHLVANWVMAGRVKLDAGQHRLRIELTSDGPSAWDAFVLSEQPFVPRGALPPGASWPAPPSGWFVFDAGSGSADSRLDLRHLNEPRAGSGGFVTAHGDRLVASQSRAELRFWGVNATREVLDLPDELVVRWARDLAAHGVNLVRFGGRLWSEADPAQLDPYVLRRLHFFVHALSEQGIYSALTPYFPALLSPPSAAGFAGYDGQKPAFGLLYFDERFQRMYRGWWRQLLRSENPFSHRSLADDPALALIELVNEDSTLFWTFEPYGKLPAEQTRSVERLFADFAKARYGSPGAALAHWGGSAVRGDAVEEGRLGLLPLARVVSQPNARARDTAEFLARRMRDFYASSRAFLEQELGYRAALVCSNWITADPRLLGPLDKWANEACDVMDRHAYFGGQHVGPTAEYEIASGDRYRDAAAVCFDPQDESQTPDFRLPLSEIGYDSKPRVVSEINWTAPNRYRAESSLLTSAYAALHGTSALLHYAMGEPVFEQTLSKFGLNDPAIFGQFYGAALVFRQGLVRRAPVVAREKLPLSALFALQGSALAEPPSRDQFRLRDLLRTASVRSGASLDPLAYLVGRVEAELDSRAPQAALWTDFEQHIAGDRSAVVSATGELRWDLARGLVQLDAAGAQGAAGYLGASSPLEFAAFRLETRMPFGSVLLVALDGEPLERSARMLLTLISESRNQGFVASADAPRKLEAIGGPPFIVRELEGDVTLRRTEPLRVRALDAQGRPLRERSLTGQSFRLLPQTLYYLVERP